MRRSPYEMDPAGDLENKLIAVLAKVGTVPADLRIRYLANKDGLEDRVALENLLVDCVNGSTELPDWADPQSPPPDCYINPYTFKLVESEPYLRPVHLARSITDCYPVDYSPTSRHYPASDIALAAWKRLLPHVNARLSEEVLTIESERGNNGYRASKARRARAILSSTAIRAGALAELYSNQDQYVSTMHGTGEVARLSVPAALFRFAEYFDYISESESFEEAVARRFQTK